MEAISVDHSHLLVQGIINILEALEKPLREYVLFLVEEDEHAVLGLQPARQHNLVDLLDLARHGEGLGGGEPAQHRHLLAQVSAVLHELAVFEDADGGEPLNLVLLGHLQVVRGNEDDPLVVQHVVDLLQPGPDVVALLLVIVRTQSTAIVKYCLSKTYWPIYMVS